MLPQSHELPSGRQTWLAMENPRTEWRFLARKIVDFNGQFSSTPCLMTLAGMMQSIHNMMDFPIENGDIFP